MNLSVYKKITEICPFFRFYYKNRTEKVVSEYNQATTKQCQ